MRKLITLIFALFMTMGVFALDSLSDINIDRNLLDNSKELLAIPDRFPESAGSYKYSTIDMKLSLIAWDYSGSANVLLDQNDSDAKWKKYMDDGYATKIENGPARQLVCKMVKISNNWLIGNSHCLPEYIRENPEINSVPSKKEAFKLMEFKSMQTEYRGLVYEIKNNEIRVDGQRIDSANHLFIGKDVMLLYIPDEVVAEAEEFYLLKMANIRISSDPKDMKVIYINEKAVDDFSIENGEIKVSSRSRGGTPAFYIKPNTREGFLIGFNSAEQGEKGKVFKLFNGDMENFIKTTVNKHTPDEWERVLSHKIVHDSYFNQ